MSLGICGGCSSSNGGSASRISGGDGGDGRRGIGIDGGLRHRCRIDSAGIRGAGSRHGDGFRYAL